MSAATAIWTLLAMVAFAANSLLCRMALGAGSIDPASFTTVRVVSGAVAMWLIAALRWRRIGVGGSWRSAQALFLYAVPFSFAYVSLATGTGALILFGAVQLTMMISALASGERPNGPQWTGLIAALAGLVYLVLPGLEAPSPLGSALMMVAGVAWGLYSLRGRHAGDPLIDTSGNFIRSVPMVLVVSAAFVGRLEITAQGALLAMLSGAVASGVGYAVWFAALGGLTATRAAVVQLSVPVLAAMGGVVVLDEVLSLRLIVASVAILGGVALVLVGRVGEVLRPRQ